jgi:hypothetical protein
MKRPRRPSAVTLRVALAVVSGLGVTMHAIAPGAAAFAAHGRAAPVTFAVSATPDSIGQLDYVWITGNTVMDGKGTGVQRVRVTISLPGGKGVVSVLVPADGANGLFKACYDQTNVVGTYAVRVASPGAGATGTTMFVVGAGYGPPDEDAKLGEIALKFESQMEKLSATLTPSPALDEMQTKLLTLRSRLTDSLKQITAFNKILTRLYALFRAYPQDRTSFEPVLHALDAWAADAKRLETRISQEIAASSQSSVRCDDISRLEQDLKDMADLIAEIEVPMKAVADFEKNYKQQTGLGLEDTIECVGSNPSLDKRKLDQNFATALKDVDPADVPAAFMDGTLKTAHDAIDSASQKLFSAYCQQFQGPFSASMHADLSQNGQVWWSYDILATGTLTLRYPADTDASSGGKQRLTGELAGNITRFAIHERALDVLFPKLKKTSLYWHFDSVPAVPQPFSLPLSGTLAGHELTLALDPAAGGTVDTAHNEALCEYVLISPYLLAPIVQKFTLPYKNMTWVIGKALGDKPASFFVGIDKQHQQLYVDRTIANARNNPGVKSTYALRVKACNPACDAS